MTEKREIKGTLGRYKRGAEFIRASIKNLSSEKLHDHPISGKWSVAECICHIVDFEIVLADRMKRIIALYNPLLIGADENEFTKKLCYARRDIELEVNLYDLIRKQMITILESLAQKDFEKTGVHNEKGKVTLWDYLLHTCWHTEHHLKFIGDKRIAMGLNRGDIPKTHDCRYC